MTPGQSNTALRSSSAQRLHTDSLQLPIDPDPLVINLV